MRGHALSGSRKLDKHWQSGGRMTLDLLRKKTFPHPFLSTKESSIMQDPVKTVKPLGASIYEYYWGNGVSDFSLFSGFLKPDIWKKYRQLGTSLYINARPFITSQYVKKRTWGGNVFYWLFTVKSIPKEWKDKNVYIRNPGGIFGCHESRTNLGTDTLQADRNVTAKAEGNVTGLATKDFDTFTGYKVELNKPLVTKIVLREDLGHEIVGVGTGVGSLAILCDGQTAEAETLTGSFKIESKLFTEAEYEHTTGNS